MRKIRTFLSGDDAPIPSHVQSANTPFYAMNFMSSGTPPSDLGDPVDTLQPGALVEAVGPSVKNSNGAPFTPVNVRGRDGVFWIRSTSIAENASAPSAFSNTPKTYAMPQRTKQAAFVPMPTSGMAWWQYGLIGLGVLAVGAGTYAAFKRK